MKLFNYVEFITEARGDVKCPAIISESFMKKCKSIDSPISKALIDMNRKMSSYTFINDNLDGETIQYTESERALILLDKIYGKSVDPQKYMTMISNPDPDSNLWDLNRVDVKIGRFVRKFLDDKFSDAEIEDFVNKWKSLKSDDSKFEFWTGDKIITAYRAENYEGEESYTPLWNSCMNDKIYLIKFYLNIPDLQIVVLLNSENKISARAFLWTDEEGRKLLDRVYYIHSSDYFRFTNLAKQNGWYYKKRNISGGSSWVLNSSEQFVKTRIKYPVESIPEYFPYVDSFYYLDDKNGYLSNYEPNSSYYFLNDTDGLYEYYSGLFDVNGRRVDNEDDYMYSNTQGGLVSLYNSEHVQYGDFDDYIEISYLEDPKNGFVFDDDEQEWYKKEDYDKMKSSK